MFDSKLRNSKNLRPSTILTNQMQRIDVKRPHADDVHSKNKFMVGSCAFLLQMKDNAGVHTLTGIKWNIRIETLDAK
jgi:hypothetical protein